MSVIVDRYPGNEYQRNVMTLCHECHFPPVWEIRQQNLSRTVGYACPDHVDQVLYLVSTDKIGPGRTLDA